MDSVSTSYQQERYIAELAVQKAVIVTRKVLALVSQGELTKGDKTQVTLADFAAQALLVAAIHHNFPNDAIVGEEDTRALRSSSTMAAQVWDLVSSTSLEDVECESLLPSPTSQEDMLRYIDLGGKGYGGPSGRVWMIDPVDGTKGFLKGGQYVVCCTMLEDGQEKIAAFGCPHVSLEQGRISEQDTDTTGPGYLISAARGQGTQYRKLSTGALQTATKLSPTKSVESMSSLRFVENCNTTSPQFADRHRIAEALGAQWHPLHIYSTQLRYLALTLGAGDVVLRTPLPGDAPAHVWDHAGGVMVFEEAGGKVTDLNGKDLVFTAGRDLTENFGLIAAPKVIHASVVQAVKSVFSEYPEYKGVVGT